MFYLDENSASVTKSELDLFSVPSTQVAIERSFWEEVRPTNTVTNAGPFEFHIDGSQYMVDMASNFLYLKLKITQDDGDDIEDPNAEREAEDPNLSDVGPINLIGKTFVKQIKMFLNSKLTYDSGTDYPYIAYLLTDLNYGRDAKDTHLHSAGYVTEWTPQVNDVDILDTWVNPGLQIRKKWFENSREAEFMAPLHVPLSHQEKYLLSNMDIRFEIHRVSNAFGLLALGDHQYKISVQDIKFYIRKVELSRALSLAIEQNLMRTTAKYPIRRLELKTLHVGQGRRTTPTNTLWNGQIPRRVIICLMRSDSYFGDYHRSPFVFRPQNLIKAALNVNGVVVPHSGPLEFQFREPNNLENEPSRVMRGFVQLYNAMGIGTADKSNGITYDRFIGDACYLAFDLSSDSGSDSNNWELIRNGPLSINLEFSQAIGVDGLRVLVMGEFDNVITVDRNRNVFYDYAV